MFGVWNSLKNLKMKNNKEVLLPLLLNQRDKNAKLVLVQEFTKESKLDDLVCVVKADVNNESVMLEVEISFNGENLFVGTLEEFKTQLQYVGPCIC